MADIFYSSWKTQSSEQGYNYQWRLGFQYTITQNQSANTSKIKREIYLYYTSSNTTNYTPFPSQFTIKGGRTNYFTTQITFSGTGNAKIYSDEVTLKHNSDGTYGNVTLSISYAGNNYQSYNSASKSVAIPKINRYPTLLSAQDFNDEQNPKVTYTTTLGFVGATVQICIAVNNSTKVPYRDVVVADGEYTFELTETERNTLRNLANTPNPLEVQFTLRTTEQDNTPHYSVLTRTMTIINANPTVSTTTQEKNANVISLLGGDTTNKIIKYVSELEFSASVSVPKVGATISNVTVNGNNATLSSGTSTSGVYKKTLSNLTSETFNIVATDTRNNTTTSTIQKTLLDYQITKINTWSVKRASQTSSNLVLNADITCYSSTIDGNTNTPTVQYSIDGSTWTTIPNSDYTFASNKITITQLTLSNLIPYQQNGKFYLKVSDLLTTSAENRDISVGIYTFAKGDRKVRINGTLEIADSNGQNRVNVMDYIDDRSNYSQEETTVGTWINGKTLYRKVVKYTNSSIIGTVGQETIIDIPHGIDALEQVWIEAMFTSDNRILPFFGGSNAVTQGVCVPVINTTNIKMRITNNAWGSRTWYFILRYTKNELPSEYTQLDYIESDGAKYIQTNYTLTNSNSAEIKVSLGATTTNQMLFGSRSGASSQNISINASTTNFSVDFNNSSYSTYRCSYAYTLNVPYIISVSKNERTVYDEDGNVLASNTTVCNDTITTPQNATLFYINPKPGSSWYIPTGAKIYYCKIWSGDTLVRDLIPCYRNNDSVVGMYDLVNNTFYTMTTE